jgi:Rrf2 family protein
MQLTRAADYGVRVMLHLAALPPGTRASRTALAAAAGAPTAFVSKVLQRLARAQLIVAHRGREGGFELALPTDRISLLDIVTALEGPLCLNVCLRPAPGPTCERRSWCSAYLVWAEVQAAMVKLLDDARLDRLAALADTRRSALGMPPLAAVPPLRGRERRARSEGSTHAR